MLLRIKEIWASSLENELDSSYEALFRLHERKSWVFRFEWWRTSRFLADGLHVRKAVSPMWLHTGKDYEYPCDGTAMLVYGSEIHLSTDRRKVMLFPWLNCHFGFKPMRFKCWIGWWSTSMRNTVVHILRDAEGLKKFATSSSKDG